MSWPAGMQVPQVWRRVPRSEAGVGGDGAENSADVALRSFAEALGRISSQPNDHATSGICDCGYDGPDRVNAILENGGTTLVSATDDIGGKRASLTRANGAVTSYAYDGVSRLSSLGHDLAGGGHDFTLMFCMAH